VGLSLIQNECGGGACSIWSSMQCAIGVTQVSSEDYRVGIEVDCREERLSNLLCIRTSVTVGCQDIGDGSGLFGGDTSGSFTVG
jgi:hypothetical protein